MWFVSKSRYEEVRAEKLELAKEVTRLNNFIAWRFGGAPTHPEIEVRPEWMKAPAAATATQEEKPEPTTAIGKAIHATGSRNPRTIANHITRQNVEEFSRTMFAVRTEAPVTKEATPLTKAQRDEVAAAGADLQQALAQ